MKRSLKLLFVLMMGLLLLTGCGNKESSKENTEKDTYDVSKAETINMDYISVLRAKYEDNQYSVEEYNGKLVKIELEISKIAAYGFYDTYGFSAQTVTMWSQPFPVVLKDPSKLKNYKLEDKVTVVGKLVVGGKINYGTGKAAIAYEVMLDKAEIIE